MNDVEVILEKAMNMPPQQRALIARRLIDSLEAKADKNIEAAWQQEIQKRMAAADRGEAEFISWEDVKYSLS
jgi:putative addiction module component (TIGR02574 family)